MSCKADSSNARRVETLLVVRTREPVNGPDVLERGLAPFRASSVFSLPQRTSRTEPTFLFIYLFFFSKVSHKRRDI